MRSAIEHLPASLIREVANAGLGRSDVLAFWFGESDEITPDFVREAAVRSLRDGETFYGHNLGMPPLRQALSDYLGSLHRPVSADRVAVTSSGVSALMLAAQALLGPADRVVAVVPVWPNLTAQPQIMGASVTRVSLKVRQGAWHLDLDALLQAITPDVRAVLINAPNNPTGWTLTREEQQAILERCRTTGSWIVADEVYERVFFASAAACAPSFLDIADEHDRLVVVHSFSKSFLMTGWRLGWMVAPAALMDTLGKLVEFNTSCAPTFVQRAGCAALQAAPTFVPELVRRLRQCRDLLLPALAALPGIEVATPPGGMYAFFRIAGEEDSLALAKRLVSQAALGLAPGVAFGPEGQGWLRWCFASRDPRRLALGVQRLQEFLRL